MPRIASVLGAVVFGGAALGALSLRAQMVPGVQGTADAVGADSGWASGPPPTLFAGEDGSQRRPRFQRELSWNPGRLGEPAPPSTACDFKSGAIDFGRSPSSSLALARIGRTRGVRHTADAAEGVKSAMAEGGTSVSLDDEPVFALGSPSPATYYGTTGDVTIASGATLTSSGSFTHALQNYGTYSPGAGPTLSSFSSFRQMSSGTMILQLGGTGRGTQYDALDVTGTISFGGTLSVNYASGYTASAGSSYRLFSSASSSGTFDRVVLPSLPAGLAWDLSGLYTVGTISVVAVPEPTTWAAWGGIAAIGLAIGRQRRKSNVQ